jgi:hypothetical protein
VQFALTKLRVGQQEPERAAESGGAVPWTDEMMGSPGWARLLDWCVDNLPASTAFVVDARGLIVGSSGSPAQDEVEEIGARLLIAFEQADQMSPGGSQSITIQRSDGWLVGLRVPLTEYEKLTVGLMTKLPLSSSARLKVEEAFARKALEL